MELKTKTPVRYFVLLIVVLFLAACGGNADYSPKPRGYYRIVYPAKQYQPYTEGCPFTFDYPKYSKVEPDKSRGQNPAGKISSSRSLTPHCI